MRVGLDDADARGLRALRVAPHRGEHGGGGLGRDRGDELAFVGHVQRVQAEQFAGRLDLRQHGDRGLVEIDADARLLRDLVERGCQAAARRVAQHVHAALGGGGEHGRDQVVQRRGVRDDRGLEGQRRALRQHGHAMLADRPRQQQHVARARARAADVTPARQHADPGGRDEAAVALALLDDLGVAGDDGDAGRTCRRGHRLHDALQVGQREALFEDEAGRQPQRARAEHRDVVDRAVHGQAAEVAAGEEQRRDHMRVGGHDQPAAGGQLGRRRQRGAVVALVQVLVVELGGEQLADELRRRAPAGAMVEVDAAAFPVERALVVPLATHAALASTRTGKSRQRP